MFIIHVQHTSITNARKFYRLRRCGVGHLEAAGWSRAEWSYT